MTTQTLAELIEEIKRIRPYTHKALYEAFYNIEKRLNDLDRSAAAQETQAKILYELDGRISALYKVVFAGLIVNCVILIFVL